MNPAISQLPILVICPHSRCNCRCLMCDIWKDPKTEEISTSDLERHLADIERLQVRWVVLSGGEPLMHSDLFRFCSLLRERQIRITLLSTGLLLDRYAEKIVETIDDVIVSLDGPQPVHDRIRRVSGAFEAMRHGIETILRLQPAFPISGRSTVQRENYACLRETACAARQLGLQSISFLAADLTSEAFNRTQPWSSDRQARIALTENEISVLEDEIEQLFAEWANTGFIRETLDKLRRIALHFHAHLNLCEPVAPSCNAPWVSAVIEANGIVRPCFFHPPIGQLNGSGLLEVLNSSEAQSFRLQLDVAKNPICRRCVCSLNWTQGQVMHSLQSFYTVPTT